MSGFSWGGFGRDTRVLQLNLEDADADNHTKLTEDRYEVLVNGERVGYKTLLNQSDSVSDIDDFLQNKGFPTFTSNLDGDHYDIQVSDDIFQNVKDTLEVYLNNR
ncbi:hypothetical protein ACLM5H_20400 [Fredinandcohnia humi]